MVVTEDTKRNVHENAMEFEHSYTDMKQRTKNGNATNDSVQLMRWQGDPCYDAVSRSFWS